MNQFVKSLIAIFSLAAEFTPLQAQSADRENPGPSTLQTKAIAEEFTGNLISKDEMKLGTEFEYGIRDDLSGGTDVAAFLAGAPTLFGRYQVAHRTEHDISLGLKGAYLSRKTILWGNLDKHFNMLEAKILRPSVAWSYSVSPRLRIHSYWAVPLGKFDAELSPYGKKKLWEAKHPGEDYEKKDSVEGPATSSTETNSTGRDQNREKSASEQSHWAFRTLQVQSLLGLLPNQFQVTGELKRTSGESILVTTRLDRLMVKDLRVEGTRLSIAQHWIRESFNFRLGAGAMYTVVSGKDLDGESIQVSGFVPVTDAIFYWRI